MLGSNEIQKNTYCVKQQNRDFIAATLPKLLSAPISRLIVRCNENLGLAIFHIDFLKEF